MAIDYKTQSLPDGEVTSALPSDIVMLTRDPTTAPVDYYIKLENLIKLVSINGWIADANTWTYSSADDPTFVISINADVTGYIGVGFRIKLTNGGSVKKFIVTAVGAFSGGATLVTVYGGTDYDLANSAITLPYYSREKAPFGFPLSPIKWTVTTTDTTSRNQATPTQNTWYNLGTLLISVPIGAWNLNYQTYIRIQDSSDAAWDFQCALSSANNAANEADLVASFGIANATQYRVAAAANAYISIAAKASYYMIMRTLNAGLDNIYFANDNQTMYLRAVCAYL